MPDTADIEARRRRLCHRHRLGVDNHAGSVIEVAGALVALHSSDPATVHLSIVARCPAATVEAIDHALYADRSLTRVLGMRRTLFVVESTLVTMIHASCTRRIAARENIRLERYLTENDTADAEGFLAAVKNDVLAALDDSPELTGRQLSDCMPALRRKIAVPGGEQGLTTLVLSRMTMDGTIVRGRPSGSWISSQYHYARAPGGGLDDPTVDTVTARRDLLATYLARFGPAGRDDRRWWTGWTAGQTDAAGSGLEVPVAEVSPLSLVPAVAVLPALDPTVMGWAKRDWYLGDHAAALFDRNGNAGPTLWVDGRIVGGWAQRPSGEIVHLLLEKVGADEAELLDAECRRIEAWMDGVVVMPRFRTPLERELSGG